MRGTIDVATYRRLPTEAQMQGAIEELVAYRGGRCWHVNDARNVPEMIDCPDLLILCPPFGAMIELKSQRRQVTDGQREVAILASQCPRFIGGIVRPDPLAREWSYEDMLSALRRG